MVRHKERLGSLSEGVGLGTAEWLWYTSSRENRGSPCHPESPACRVDVRSGGNGPGLSTAMHQIPVCFIADLHLFSRRSRGHLLDDKIVAAARRSRICVLGGDIFDFKWSALPTVESTVERAVAWLCELMEAVPDCQFHFVLGNHDDHPELVSQLPGLSQKYANFFWDRFYLRLGDTIFLHGDAADRQMTPDRLKARRESFSHERRKRLANQVYNWIVRAQMHRIIPHAVYWRPVVASRLIKYLRDIGHGPEDGVRQVCFGHTHRPLEGYCQGGMLFHNGGAPIGRARYRIVEIDVETQDADSLHPD